mmetsp:Transcript_40683/g.131001  ORF Transcript_40683/g.131001 Transcript_40683/m.131001 type:complete len:220 (+) Transcript_40683:1659-2318(+)
MATQRIGSIRCINVRMPSSIRMKLASSSAERLVTMSLPTRNSLDQYHGWTALTPRISTRKSPRHKNSNARGPNSEKFLCNLAVPMPIEQTSVTTSKTSFLMKTMRRVFSSVLKFPPLVSGAIHAWQVTAALYRNISVKTQNMFVARLASRRAKKPCSVCASRKQSVFGSISPSRAALTSPSKPTRGHAAGRSSAPLQKRQPRHIPARARAMGRDATSDL